MSHTGRSRLAVVTLAIAALACSASDFGGQAATTGAPTLEPTLTPTLVEPTATAAPTHTPGPTDTPEIISGITAKNAHGLGQIFSITAAPAQSPILAGALDPNLKQGATFAFDKYVRIWDLETGERLFELGPHSADGFGLAYSPDGSMLASGGGFEVIIWNPATGELLGSVTTDAYVFRVVWSPDGKQLAVVGGGSSRIQLIDVKSARVTDEIRTPAGNVLWAAAYSPDGSQLAVGDNNGNLTVFNLPGKAIAAESGVGKGAVWDMEFSPDGSLLVSCNGSGDIFAWNAGDWTINQTMTRLDAHYTAGQAGGCADGVFTPDSSVYFSAGADGIVYGWEVETGDAVYGESFRVSIWTISISGDGSYLALAVNDGRFIFLGLGGGPIEGLSPDWGGLAAH